MTRRVVLIFLVIASGLCFAQSTAMLSGTVVDSSGATVPQASVVCTNAETAMKSSATTSRAGTFKFPDLPVGLYDVTITQSGFESLVRRGIRLLTDQTVDLTFTLHVGSTGQSVEVSAPAPLVQRATSDLGTTVDSRQMADLPLNGRNAFDLAALAPGATETVSQTIPGQQENTGLAVNGLSAIDNNWTLDGATYTNRASGGAPTLPNPDTLQEFTARTANYDASSRGAGASVKLTTRSGTNQFHGTLFEFLRNSVMDARNFFDPGVEPYKQNQYGGTVGGPIKKDKLFFFGSFQGTNQRGDPSPVSMTVPDALECTGNYSQSGKTIVDPTTKASFPNDTIPTESHGPDRARSAGSSSPFPTWAANLCMPAATDNRDDYQWLGKVDYLLDSKDHHFPDVTSGTTMRSPATSTPARILCQYLTFTNQTVLVSDAHIFSPTWIMTLSYNYLRTFRNEVPTAPVTMQSLGAQVPFASANDGGKIDVSISGYTSAAISGGSVVRPAAQEPQVDVSHVTGSHLLRFGGGLRHDTDNAFVQNDGEAGGWAFDTSRTSISTIKNSGDSWASLLLGLPTTFSQASSSPNDYLVTTFDAWVQDDWKVLRRLTLNMGLRYEPWLPPHDAKGYMAGFLPGVQSTVAPLAPRGLLFGGDAGIPQAIAQNNWKTFSPRFGFAWDVFGDGKTIVRSGYGVFRSGTEFFGLVSTLANSVPFRTASVSIPDPPTMANPYAGYGPIPFPYTPPSTLANYKFANNIAIRVLNPQTTAGYTQSWNFTLERQLTRDTAVTASYVGNHVIGIMTRYQANPGLDIPGATTANVNTRRLYPGFGNLTLAGSWGWSRYDGLQLQVTKRAARGLTMLVNYTYSKAMSIDSSGAFATALGAGPRDPYNLALDYSPADYDVTQAFKAAVIYELPAMHAGPAAVRGGSRVNGWQINTMITAQTGLPFTCRSGVDDSMTSTGNDTCDQIGNAARPAGANPLQEWFNTAAFTKNAVGTFGNAGRNDMRRPDVVNVNLSLFRHFRITEKLQAEFRAEAFNALNHPNFDLFFITNSYTNSETIGSPTFGQITHAQDPRLMQLALKLKF